MYHNINSILIDRELFTVKEYISVFDCASLMLKHHIGSLPVQHSDTDKIIGIISERDITRKVVAVNANSRILTAKNIMHEDVTVLDCNESIEKAMNIIQQTRRRHMLISRDNKIISLISIGDLMKHVLNDKAEVIEQLETYIHS